MVPAQHSPTSHEKNRSSALPTILAITPFENPDTRLFQALQQAPQIDAVLDCGHDPARAEAAVDRCNPGAVRIAGRSGFDVRGRLAPQSWVITDLHHPHFSDLCEQFRVLVQVTSLREAKRATEAGIAGLIAKGAESGGCIGPESSYILFQRILRASLGLPLYVQGGIGRHTAAAIVAAGGSGVILDSQLALFPESRCSAATRRILQGLDGGETRVVDGVRFLAKPGTAGHTSEHQTAAALYSDQGVEDPGQDIIMLGQDIGLAKWAADHYSRVGDYLAAVATAIGGHIEQAKALKSLAIDSPLAQHHQTRFPIAQGPMTRVSDNADFALAVADNGALPFLALSLMREKQARSLLEETRTKLGEKSWGVGILGFAPSDIRDRHLALIREFKPKVVLIAGGRPSQARALEKDGIQTYLHVPAPGLLDLFLKDGARGFVFEGRECGGHVGPRMSFPLWEQQIERLLAFEDCAELRLLFAGGIHDAASAAMVAAMTAPLAARGAKIGVLMGTAYIGTHEAVTSGAVLDTYQQQVLEHAQTTLLETAPGHATRCLATPFVDAFEVEKQRLRDENRADQEIWQSLEQLNVGRLRIASKGIERQGDDLVSVDHDRQLREGMYMIGQVAHMMKNRQTMADLHSRVCEGAVKLLDACQTPELSQPNQHEDLAIVGMACVYPGAPDLDTYWHNIVMNRDAVSEVPADRWRVADYYDPQGTGSDGKTGCKWGGFIDEVPFNPLKYGIPPQSLAAIEPTQLLALEVAKRALDDAGYAEKTFGRERTSVIFGAESGTDLAGAYGFRNIFKHYLGDMPAELDAALPTLTEDSFPGVLANVISGRIANRLDLGGCNYTVDAACASSLAAVELAAKELMLGTSDMVLAGGADLHNSINDYLMFSSVHALSRKGRCRSFDSEADGIVLGEGVAVVVMKRLSDAQRDGDRVYAVLKGIAGASDGKSLGLTAPRKEGQKRTLERAYRAAGVAAGKVGLVEAHGTGTVVGDRTEMQTLTEVFTEAGAVPASCTLGSVKSQIGHTKCAAGLAGLIKVAKALYHRVLPPTNHVERPNPIYDTAPSPFRLENEARPWLGDNRIGAVSAFGFGGTNFHAVLGEAPESAKHGYEQWSDELFLLRGASRQAAQATAAKLRPFATLESTVDLRDLSLTVNGDGQQPVWFAFTARDKTELDIKLGAICDGVAHQGVYPYAGEVAGKVAFLFPGQGSQRPHMVNDLLVAFPECQEYADRAGELPETWFPAKSYHQEGRKAQQKAITDTRVAQPLLGLAGMLTHHVLQRFGLKADALAGHSYGELTALCAAGALDLDTLVPLSRARAESMLAAAPDDPGTMAAVKAPADVVEANIAGLDMVVAANQNSPRQTVISGPTVAIEKAMIRLEEAGLSCKKIPVACAFHSPVLAAAEGLFAKHLTETDFQTPHQPVYANLTAEPHGEDASAIRATLARHLVSPVLFQTQIENMYRDGIRCFVEVGPGGVLTQLTQRILRDKPHLSLTTEGAGLSRLLDTLAQLAAQGHAVNPAPLLRERGAQLVDLEAAVPRLHAATWMVNGQIARPLKGKQPAHALKLLDAPLELGFGQAMPVPTPVERDQAVLTYLQGVREMVQAGRQVMAQYLGQGMPAMPVVAHDTPFIAPLDPITMTTPQTGLLPVGPTIADAVESAERQAAAAPVKRDIPKTLLAIVAERTGYPEDMLDMDLDLEADLSIDSIKRIEIIGELAEQLGLHESLAGGDSDEMMEALAAQKTLRAMLAWLEEVLPAEEEAVAAETQEAAPQQNMQQLLLEIVSERTGYPEDVLELDLDLEADLSIDSIKRLEIVGELAEKAGFSTVGDDQDALVESLAAMKTLRAIVNWLEQGRETTQKPAADTKTAPAPAATPSLSEVSRFILTLDQAPTVVKGDFLLKDKHFLITDDTLGLAPLLAVRLQNHDAKVRIINLGEAASGDWGKVDGLIHLAGLAPHAEVADVKTFFTMMQTLLAAGAGYLLAAGGLGGAFGHYAERGDAADGYARGGGLAGLIKTVAKELPEIRTHWIDLDPAESLEHLADYLEAELLADNPLTEVAYKQGERRAVKLIEARLDAEMTERVGKLQLDKDSVVVITGGARGITAKIALELARQYGCNMELVGRSPWPTEDEDPATVGAEDKRELRKILIQQGGKKSPAEIERAAGRILAQREMRRNLAAMEACGSVVRYHALDVRDHAAFEQFIDAVYDHHGHIEGVIHGAGVVEDKLLRHKTAESFERVFDTKVFGALVLAKKLRAETRFVVFFSSVAGAFGNRGQVDYAAANDVLDKIAHALQTRIQGRVVSINWGPWAGKGMVSPELEREYNRRGIGLIPIDSGVSAFMNELTHGRADDTQVVLMCAQPESMR